MSRSAGLGRRPDGPEEKDEELERESLWREKAVEIKEMVQQRASKARRTRKSRRGFVFVGEFVSAEDEIESWNLTSSFRSFVVDSPVSESMLDLAGWSGESLIKCVNFGIAKLARSWEK